MPISRTYRPMLFLMTTWFAACAADVSELNEERDELVALHGELGSCPKPCVLSAAPKGYAAIQAKLAGLPAALRAGSFARQTTPITSTTEFGPFVQHFDGPHGRGVIVVNGAQAFAIHGAIRDVWERERDRIGYPTSDEYDWAGGRRQKFDSYETDGPDHSNGCAFGADYVVDWYPDARGARVAEENFYWMDEHPGYRWTYPQPVTWQEVRPNLAVPWCGPLPEWWDEFWGL